MLEADEVLAVGRVLGNRGRESGLTPGAPGVVGKVATRVAHTLLEDLEPVAGPVVCLNVVAGSTRHVDVGGAWSDGRQDSSAINTSKSMRKVLTRMLEVFIRSEPGGELGTGGNGQHGVCNSGVLVAPGVGANIDDSVVKDVTGGVGRKFGRVVQGAIGLADVLPGSAGLSVVDGDIEPVVCTDTLGEDGGGGSETEKLHGEYSSCGLSFEGDRNVS